MENRSIIDALTSGQPVKIEVSIDIESIAILASAMVVAVLLGNIIAAAIVK